MVRFLPNPKLKLRDQLREVMGFKHFSHRTESAYWHWIKDVATTQVYTHVMAKPGLGVRSPLDEFPRS